MRYALCGVRPAVLAVTLALCAASCSKRVEAEKSAPNIWGVWIGFGDENPDFRNTPYPSPPDFTEWGAAESKRLATSITPGECNPWPPAMFMAGSNLFPIQILQGPNVIVIHYEAVTQPRRIYVDGRSHPPSDELLPTFLGHSIGRWEGDTLVVDTVGTNGRARPINGYISGSVISGPNNAPRLPGSDQLHFMERIRLVGGGDYLEDTMTIDDPKTYRKPWTVSRYWQRRPDIDMQEYACTDNSRPDAEGQTERAAAAR
jgi:hypothetical protein